jgi:hypothetical protein
MKRKWKNLIPLICSFVLLIVLCIISLFTRPQLLVEIKAPAKDMFQIFYDYGNGFSENDSVIIPYEEEIIQHLEFNLPRKPFQKLRLDPATQPMEINLYGIELKCMFFSRTWDPSQIIIDFYTANHIPDFEVSDDSLRLVSTGNDPQFVYNKNINTDILGLRIFNFVFIAGVSIAFFIVLWGLLSLLIMIFTLPKISKFFSNFSERLEKLIKSIPPKGLELIRVIFLVVCIFFLILVLGSLSREPVFVIETVAPEDDFFQVFYDTGEGFRERDSVRRHFSGSEDIQKLSFNLPVSAISGLRIDPGTKDIEIKIYSLTLKYLSFSRTWKPDDILKDFKPWHHISDFEDNKKFLRLTSTGEDPHFVYVGNELDKFYNTLNFLRKRRVFVLVFILIIIALIFISYLYFLARLVKFRLQAKFKDKDKDKDKDIDSEYLIQKLKSLGNWSAYLFLIFMALIIISGLRLEFLRQIAWLDGILSFIKDSQFVLSLLTVLFAFLAFYFNKQSLKVDDRDKSDPGLEKELQRNNEFDTKFIKLSHLNIDYGIKTAAKEKRFFIFILRLLISPFIWFARLPYIIVKWMYKEGWGYSISVILIVLVGFALRIHNIIILDPYTDEYFHLVAAKDWVLTGKFDYFRAPIVTYFVRLFFLLGNASSFYGYLFWGRIPGIVFGALTIVPLYFISKKISKPIGIIAASLYAISPWAIAVSRNIREYAVYPFFILIACIILIKLIEFIVNYKDENRLNIVVYSILIFLFSFYAYKIDFQSTLKIAFLAFAIIILFFVIMNFKKLIQVIKKSRKALVITLITALLIVITGLLVLHKSNHVFINQLSIRWVDFYFANSSTVMQWWYNSNFIYISYFFLGLGLIYALIKGNRWYFLLLFVFVSFLIFFIVFFDRYMRPRYIYHAFPFFVVIVASGVYSLISFVKMYFKKYMKVIYLTFLSLFLFFSFDFRNTLYTITSDTHGYVKMTNEYHDKVQYTIDFLETEIQDSDVFISTIFTYALQLAFDIEKDRIFHYRYSDDERFDMVVEVMKNNSQGLMILDSRRNGGWVLGFPKSGEFKVNDTLVKVLRNEDSIQVYRWKHQW